MNPSAPHQWSSPRLVRQIFNRERYWERVKAGEWTEDVLRDDHPSRPTAQEARCTRSQYIAYIDEQGREIAHVHQYLRRDGTIGASGRPDPKAVYFNGTVYYCDVNY